MKKLNWEGYSIVYPGCNFPKAILIDCISFTLLYTSMGWAIFFWYIYIFLWIQNYDLKVCISQYLCFRGNLVIDMMFKVFESSYVTLMEATTIVSPWSLSQLTTVQQCLLKSVCFFSDCQGCSLAVDKPYFFAQRGGKVQFFICSVFYLWEFRSADEVRDVLLSWQLWSEKEGSGRWHTQLIGWFVYF